MTELVKIQSWMIQPSGYNCDRPVEYEFQSEARIRDCGRCLRCIARKKRDVAGRAAAEAYTSAEVVVWTLTYRPGEPGALDFVTDDRERFLKRVRDWLMRRARAEVGCPKRFHKLAPEVVAEWRKRIAEVLPVVRLMGCGERGKRSTKRCHWHVILFMSRKSGFVSTPRQADGKPGRENHELWPHGFANVHVLPDGMDEKMKAVRYACKYLSKSQTPTRAARHRGEKPEARFFRSVATPLGFAYLTDWARQHAQQGLPVRGDYRVPGVRFSRGKDGRPPDHVSHILTGRMRDHYIRAYYAEWQRLRPHIPIPMTEWLLRFGDMKLTLREKRALSEGELSWDGSEAGPEMRVSPKARSALGERRKRNTLPQPKPPVPVVPKRDRSGVLAVDVPGKGNVGMVELLYSGFAQWIAKDGTIYPIPHGTIRDYVRMDDAAHVRVEAWIKDRRGPEWVSATELRAMRMQRHLDRREAVERWAKRGPSVLPDHVEGRLQPLTGLYRKLRLNGTGHIPGTVVQHPGGKADELGRLATFIRPKTGLRKPIAMRMP